jgi:hypothetical protein
MGSALLDFGSIAHAASKTMSRGRDKLRLGI